VVTVVFLISNKYIFIVDKLHNTFSFDDVLSNYTRIVCELDYTNYYIG
jgi:hypothetical protein